MPACCSELRGECRGRLVGQRRVWPWGVVVLSPRSDRLSGLVEVDEQRLVQQLGPHLAIEALDLAFLHGLTRRDVAPLDPLILRPGEDGERGELHAVVADDHAGPASPLDEGGKPPGYPMTGIRDVRDGGQALVGDVSDQVENPKPAAVGDLVMAEVQRPSGIRPCLHQKGNPDANGPLAALALAHPPRPSSR